MPRRSTPARLSILALVLGVPGTAGALPPPPTIMMFSPTNVAEGSPVDITGTDIAGATSVTVNGTSFPFTVTSDTSLTAIVPAGATSGPVRITTPQGTATSGRHLIVVTTCVQALDPVTTGFPASGGAGVLHVTAGAGCAWTTWWDGQGVTVTSGTFGTGNGTVTYLMDANVGSERDVTLIVGARPATVRQIGWLNETRPGLVGTQNGSLAWGDYDGDGDLDVLLTGINLDIGDVSRVYRNDGGGTFTDVGAALPGVHVSSAVWGDYDGDGDLDILLAGFQNGVGRVAGVFRNDGGAFTDAALGLTPVSSSSGAWGDYDHDGDLDFVLAGDDGVSGLTRVYRNDGGGVFTNAGAALIGVYAGAVDWADYDGDLDLDLLVTGRSAGGPVSKVYRNDGSAFVEIAAGLPGLEFSVAEWGDYDGDGDPDILLAGRDSSGAVQIARVYRNDGAGAFTDIRAGLLRSTDGAATWGDYDGDGDLDIVINGLPWARLYRNDGGGVFTDTDARLAGTQEAFAWGDYDQDGDLDALLGGWGGFGSGVTLLFRANTTPGAFFSLRPCRLLDTRNAPGSVGGPALAAGTERVFRLFEQCRIPPTARAVSVNFTVTQPTTLGHLRLYAAQLPPPAVSSLNYGAGQTRGSNALVGISGAGDLAVYCTQPLGSAHFILDVTGYFE